MQSTSAQAVIMSDCMLRVEAVLVQCRCMCPLLVAVEHGRWFLINSLTAIGPYMARILGGASFKVNKLAIFFF